MSFSVLLGFIALAVLSAAKVTLQGVGLRRCVNGPWEARRFTALMFVSVTAVLWLLFRPSAPAKLTVLYALAFGLSNAGFQLCYAQSLRCGPVSLTVLIVSLAAFVLVLYGVIWEHDPVTPWLAAGLVCMGLSLVLCLKHERNAAPVSLKWLLFTALGFITNAAGYIVLRRNRTSSVAYESNTMMVVAMAFAAALTSLTLIPGIAAHRRSAAPLSPNGRRGLLLCLLGVGVSPAYSICSTSASWVSCP